MSTGPEDQLTSTSTGPSMFQLVQSFVKMRSYLEYFKALIFWNYFMQTVVLGIYIKGNSLEA